MLITGGAGGIGRALAARFLAEGHQVLLVDHRADALEHVRRSLHGVRTAPLDITDTAALEDLALREGADPEGPDVLINNAGIHRATALTSPDYPVVDQLRDIDLEMRTNFIALAQNCALWIPYLRRRPGGATIVNISSALAFIPKLSSATYCASKAAIHQFSRVLSQQLLGTKVRVVVVYPPLVATRMTQGRDIPGMMSADRFAELFYRPFSRGRSEIRVGESRWLYWLHRVSPGLAAQMIEP